MQCQLPSSVLLFTLFSFHLLLLFQFLILPNPGTPCSKHEVMPIKKMAKMKKQINHFFLTWNKLKRFAVPSKTWNTLWISWRIHSFWQIFFFFCSHVRKSRNKTMLEAKRPNRVTFKAKNRNNLTLMSQKRRQEPI